MRPVSLQSPSRSRAGGGVHSGAVKWGLRAPRPPSQSGLAGSGSAGGAAPSRGERSSRRRETREAIVTALGLLAFSLGAQA